MTKQEKFNLGQALGAWRVVAERRYLLVTADKYHAMVERHWLAMAPLI
jgi:hypothetical protein